MGACPPEGMWTTHAIIVGSEIPNLCECQPMMSEGENQLSSFPHPIIKSVSLSMLVVASLSLITSLR